MYVIYEQCAIFVSIVVFYMLVFDGTAVRMDELSNTVDEVGSLSLAAVYAPVRDEFHEETPSTLEVSGCVEAKEERKAFNSVCEGCRFLAPSCHCGMSTSDDSSDDDSECEVITRLREKYALERERAAESQMKERVDENTMDVAESEMKEHVDENAMDALLFSKEVDGDCCSCGVGYPIDCMDSPSDVVTSSSDGSDVEACEVGNEAKLEEEHAAGDEEGDDKEEEVAGEKCKKEAKREKRKERDRDST